MVKKPVARVEGLATPCTNCSRRTTPAEGRRVEAAVVELPEADGLNHRQAAVVTPTLSHLVHLSRILVHFRDQKSLPGPPNR
jgi:hypothetical protein